MAITERTTIALDGELGTLFGNLDTEEQAAIAPIVAKRSAMVSAILASKGMLAAVNEADIKVTVEHGEIVLTPGAV